MEKAEILFESYNMAIEESYNKIFMSNKAQDLLNIEDENIKQQLDEDMNNWANTPVPDIGGVSPAAYFDGITDIEYLTELFKMASKLCDADIPEPLADRLKSFNTLGVNKLLDLAADDSLLYDDEDQIISLMAIRTLGRWKVDSCLEPLLQFLFGLREEMDVVIEEVCSTMVQLGSSSAIRIMDILNESENVGNLEEYLLDTLVKIGIGAQDKSLYELIFRTLKSTFRKMNNKLFGAICLGNFGDGRAIPALRGYVEKNKHSVKYETFIEIKSAVNRLGGNMDDIDVSF